LPTTSLNSSKSTSPSPLQSNTRMICRMFVGHQRSGGDTPCNEAACSRTRPCARETRSSKDAARSCAGPRIARPLRGRAGVLGDVLGRVAGANTAPGPSAGSTCRSRSACTGLQTPCAGFFRCDPDPWHGRPAAPCSSAAASSPGRRPADRRSDSRCRCAPSLYTAGPAVSPPAAPSRAPPPCGRATAGLMYAMGRMQETTATRVNSGSWSKFSQLKMARTEGKLDSFRSEARLTRLENGAKARRDL